MLLNVSPSMLDQKSYKGHFGGNWRNVNMDCILDKMVSKTDFLDVIIQYDYIGEHIVKYLEMAFMISATYFQMAQKKVYINII